MLLHLVERLEAVLGKLPASIQRPILRELTPLKELFLQQRPPRVVLTGSSRLPLHEILPALFASERFEEDRQVLTEIFCWQEVTVGQHGTVALLDARGSDAAAESSIRDELQRQPADVFLFLDDVSRADARRKRDVEDLESFLVSNDAAGLSAKAVGVICRDSAQNVTGKQDGAAAHREAKATESKVRTALEQKPLIRERLLQVVEIPVGIDAKNAEQLSAARQLMSLLTDHLPNEARVEMVRVSGDREAQVKIAQVMVKSATAICTAIGAQPIPLADLPILTALQLLMVSGIMYISGRERNIRGATEFLAAMGANVGAGMLLREGTRVALKFFPGWGNVVCGMVAGAGTYAVGRAAIVYFLEGLTLKDAKRVYSTSRKKPAISKARKSRLIAVK